MPESTPRRRILIVDDEADLVGPLARRLSASPGVEVATAADGRDGLRKALLLRPDVALIDLAMPEMDGWHLCRALREDERTRKTRLVIMTAWAAKDLAQRAASEGIARVLLKPFEDRDLMAALNDDTPLPQRKGAA